MSRPDQQVLLRAAVVALALSLTGCPSDPSGVDSGGPADTRSGACTGDDECSDGLFCNGRERCEPMAAGADSRGCVAPRGRPCLEVQLCEEADDRCVTDCGVDRDADGDGLDAAECGGRDCDDADVLRFPGNVEVCDGEAHDEDCDATTFGARDLDRDGTIDAACCNEDAAGVRSCGDDCDDTRRGVRPTGIEICNGFDDDCNGMEDDGVLVPAFIDGDRDLHGDTSAMACPGTVGFSIVDDDCDDMRRDVHGAQIEVCDAVDNDCDGRVDEQARPVTWYRDVDGDGFGRAASGTMVSCAPLDGFSLLPSDCDDDNRSISPAGVEICNGLDDDCNGLADFRVGVNDREDDDGDGDPDAACGGTDCDDGDPAAHVGAPELCDFRDSDCDGLSDLGPMPPAGGMADTTDEVDWYVDVDQDGWGAEGSAIRSCEPQPGRMTRGGDCADEDPTRHPGAVDRCDGIDDDCDGERDEDGVELAYYADTDGDRDGDGTPTLACRPPAGLTELPGDCAPTDPTRGPGLYELCNAIDDDCDTDVDEEMFHDVDGDGHGDPMAPVVGACTPGDVGRAGDCNDLVDSRNPDLAESCNGLDDDCDGDVDEPGAELCVAGSEHGMCMAGACSFTCAMGEADCDGDETNGCEATLATDETHCGRCDQQCGIAGRCQAGVCDPIVGVSVGESHTCAWRSGGTVLCWGTNSMGELGVPTIASSVGPVAVPGIEDATSVCSGGFFNCARRRTGEVWCWGMGTSGQRGVGLEALGGWEPVAVPGLSDATEVACGYLRACAVRASGRVYCWGGGGMAQYGSTEAGPHPREVVGLDDVTRLDMIAWHDDLYAVTTDGRLYVLGGPTISGGGTYEAVRELTSLFPGPVARVADSAVRNGCALLRSGALHCWGSGSDWLDAGGATPTPRVADPSLWTGVTEVSIAGAGAAMCGVMADGRVRCSGYCSSYGEGLRGDGCAAPVDHGTYATGLDDAIHLSAYANRFCAVRRRGDVVCWGSGALGSGVSSTPIPLRIASD